MRKGFAIVGVVLVFATTFCRAEAYEPLRASTKKILHDDLIIKDANRNREIPIRVYFPQTRTPAPLVLFSHGLGGSREGYTYLGEHWASRGYICVFLQHHGSDDLVWRNVPPNQRFFSFLAAANVQNFVLRVQDVGVVLDQVTRWEDDTKSSLHDRIDLEKIAMAGHSFGGLTTQAVSGEQFVGQADMTDRRIKAAVIMSPSAMQKGARKPEDSQIAFSPVKIPWLLLTGTRDISPLGNSEEQSEEAVFPALPAGGKFLLVLDGATHNVFSGRRLPIGRVELSPHYSKAILAVTTAFFDAYLKQDPSAQTWLTGDGVKQVIRENDVWRAK